MRPVIVDPYPEFNRECRKFLRSMSDEEFEEILREAGIIDRKGNLTKKYRTPPEELAAAEQKAAKTRKASPKKAARKKRR